MGFTFWRINAEIVSCMYYIKCLNMWLCVCWCMWSVRNTVLRLYIIFEVLYLHIFVDLVRCGVLTLAGEILCNRNGCHYSYYQMNQQFHFMACSCYTFHLHQTNLRTCWIFLYLAVTKKQISPELLQNSHPSIGKSEVPSTESAPPPSKQQQ